MSMTASLLTASAAFSNISANVAQTIGPIDGGTGWARCGRPACERRKECCAANQRVKVPPGGWPTSTSTHRCGTANGLRQPHDRVYSGAIGVHTMCKASVVFESIPALQAAAARLETGDELEVAAHAVAALNWAAWLADRGSRLFPGCVVSARNACTVGANGRSGPGRIVIRRLRPGI